MEPFPLGKPSVDLYRTRNFKVPQRDSQFLRMLVLTSVDLEPLRAFTNERPEREQPLRVEQFLKAGVYNLTLQQFRLEVELWLFRFL